MIKNMAEIIQEAQNFAQTKIIANHLSELKEERDRQTSKLINYYRLQGYVIVGR